MTLSLTGQVLNDTYRVGEQLGAGAMGAVYEAEHERTGRRVAIKVLLGEELSETAMKRLEREAHSAGSLATRHIAGVLDISRDEASGFTFLVMELLRGEDLQCLVRREGAIDPERVLAMIAQACIGLQKAHEGGVIHRDIKLANIFLAEGEDDELVVKLLDFGIAKVRGPAKNDESAELTKTGEVLGSPIYMSPEQAVSTKNVDHRTDLWSLGVVFYYMLCGRAPFAHCETLSELLISICSVDPPSVETISPWVDPAIVSIVRRALMRNVNERYGSAKEMLADIKKLLPNGYALSPTAHAGAGQATQEPDIERIDLDKVGGNDTAHSATQPGRSEVAREEANTRGKQGRLAVFVSVGFAAAALLFVGWRELSPKEVASTDANRTAPSTTESVERPVRPTATASASATVRSPRSASVAPSALSPPVASVVARPRVHPTQPRAAKPAPKPAAKPSVPDELAY